MNEESPLVQYIKQLENPDREGFSIVTNRWYRPNRKGFDSQQYGYGLDKNTNNEFRNFLNTINRDYITPEEERKYRLGHINGYLTDIWNKRTKEKQFSDKKKIMAYGLMYHGYGPKLWNKGNPIYDTFWNGSDEDMVKAVSEFYKGLNSERAKQHVNYWKNYKEPYKLMNQNPLPQWQPPIQFKQQGGIFTGAGAGGSWDTTSDTFDGVSNFNEAFDNAVQKGLREFIFQGRRYNTKKENNPVREYNNRWVGQTRSADVNNPSKTYDRQAGPLRGPMSLIPMVTDTHVGSPERPPQLVYNPNAMEYFSSPFRSYQTAAPKKIRIKRALGGCHFKNKLTVKSN